MGRRAVKPWPEVTGIAVGFALAGMLYWMMIEAMRLG